MDIVAMSHFEGWSRRGGDRWPHDSMGRPFARRDSTDDRRSHPYSFSEVYHFGFENRSDGYCSYPEAESMYDDRMRMWSREVESMKGAWERACEEVPGRFDQMTPKSASKFLTAYRGKPTEAVALIEGCNRSNGYPYFIFFFKDATRA